MDEYKISKYLIDNGINEGDKILVALSGGVDSLSLVHILKTSKLGLNCFAAHMNFNLRGDESERDNAFVEQWCNDNKIPLFVKKVDTYKYSRENKVSIEMAARDLRYLWFYSLMQDNNIKYLAVGHNADDNAETLLLNLVRGTGLKGLCGIASFNGKIIRPLISYTRKEIEKYALYHKLQYRVDSTNLDTDFTRNKIRNIIFPQLEKINPSLVKTLNRNIKYFNLANQIIEEQTKLVKKNVCNEFLHKYLRLSINIDKLLETNNWQYYLYNIIQEYNFNSSQAEDISIYLTEEYSGIKRIDNANYTLIVERGFVKVYDIDIINLPQSIIICESNINKEIVFGDIVLKLDFKDNSPQLLNIIRNNNDINTQYINADILEFPLTCRVFEKGDRFTPLGMNRQKKISDFFTDLKIENLLKYRQPILINPANNIICLPGLRIDNKFRVKDESKKILSIKMIPKD